MMRLGHVFSAYRFKLTVFIFGVITVALLAAAAAKSRAAKPTIVIKMMDMPLSFEPAQTTVKAGDTIEWQNIGNQLHHVTTDAAAALKKADVSTPSGAKP